MIINSGMMSISAICRFSLPQGSDHHPILARSQEPHKGITVFHEAITADREADH